VHSKAQAIGVCRGEGRQRSSDRWIPFKFPERPTVVRSAEAAREISHREIGVLKVVRTGTLKVSIS
jgi:hypothetical protein